MKIVLFILLTIIQFNIYPLSKFPLIKGHTLKQHKAFSKNVMINYLDNKITGEYLDFSPNRNSMILSRQVVYTNPSNNLKADVVEINLKTKDTKIFMYEKNKKVNIESKY